MKFNQKRYEAIAHDFDPRMPWELVGVIHNMECGLSFQKHLHNGDWLSARTKRVPAGHPVAEPLSGKLPYTFEESAHDALSLKFKGWKDYDIEGVLYKLEGFNGYGYRQYHPHVNSPYLWSFTNQYKIGKYAADGVYDPNLVSQQIGIAALFKSLS